MFADAVGQAQALDADDFSEYGTSGHALDELRARFAAWRAELLG